MSAAPADRAHVDGRAVGLMVLLCMLWGLQQVAVKSVIPQMTALMQGGLRSLFATLLLAAWMRWRGIALLPRDGTLGAGLLVGALFGVEFGCIYGGLALTTASRMAVFVYLAPPLTALGVHLFVPGERLRGRQWVGIGLAFAGIVAAFGEGFGASQGSTARGDLLGICAAVLWAATTVVIRSTALSAAKAETTLLYQLAMSAWILLAASRLLGEAGIVALTPAVLTSLAYQTGVVAFASYLTWFWLLTRYLAGRLAVFSFLTPLFGVLFGVVLLGDPITPLFALAAVLVGSGIALASR